jgi:quercetin dioxygenase-like cupin family protein
MSGRHLLPGCLGGLKLKTFVRGITEMHSLLRAGDLVTAPAFTAHSSGFKRGPAVDRERGAIHTALGICTLESNGHLDLCVQSYEETFYVLEGEPILVLDRDAFRLTPGACGVIPTGVPHAWIGSGRTRSRWIDMLSPQPRGAGMEPDTFFLGPPPKVEVQDLDIRDPRSRNLFRMRDHDIVLDELKIGARVDAPTVSASMATAVLAYSGIAVKMLVDQRLGAAMSTMFMVEYQPGAVAHPHDHPLEEAYVMLDGEVVVVADQVRYTLKPGDIFWTGVGCVHAFYNESGKTVRWLETASPQPPLRHSYRFSRDWDYLTERLGGAAQ